MVGTGGFPDPCQHLAHYLGLDRQEHHLGLHHRGRGRCGLHPQLVHLRLPGPVRVVIDQVLPGYQAIHQESLDNGAAHGPGADKPKFHSLKSSASRLCH